MICRLAVQTAFKRLSNGVQTFRGIARGAETTPDRHVSVWGGAYLAICPYLLSDLKCQAGRFERRAGDNGHKASPRLTGHNARNAPGILG